MTLVLLDLLFEVTDVFGKRIRTTKKYWQMIVAEKHKDLEFGPADVKMVIKMPDSVNRSINDSTIALYRKKMNQKIWLVAVVKHVNEHGFLVTTYQTSKSKKKGEQLWPK